MNCYQYRYNIKLIKKSRKSLLGVGLLVLAPSLDDNLELPLVEGHQAEVEAGEEAGEAEEEGKEDEVYLETTVIIIVFIIIVNEGRKMNLYPYWPRGCSSHLN